MWTAIRSPTSRGSSDWARSPDIAIDAPEIRRGVLEPPAHLPQEQDQEGVGEHERQEGQGRLELPRAADSRPGARRRRRRSRRRRARSARAAGGPSGSRRAGSTTTAGSRDAIAIAVAIDGWRVAARAMRPRVKRGDRRDRPLAVGGVEVAGSDHDPDAVDRGRCAEQDRPRLPVGDAGGRLEQADRDRGDADEADEPDEVRGGRDRGSRRRIGPAGPIGRGATHQGDRLPPAGGGCHPPDRRRTRRGGRWARPTLGP